MDIKAGFFSQEVLKFLDLHLWYLSRHLPLLRLNHLGLLFRKNKLHFIYF